MRSCQVLDQLAHFTEASPHLEFVPTTVSCIDVSATTIYLVTRPRRLKQVIAPFVGQHHGDALSDLGP
jgi:hypothetical protein